MFFHFADLFKYIHRDQILIFKNALTHSPRRYIIKFMYFTKVLINIINLTPLIRIKN